MRILLTIIAFLGVIASPALAQYMNAHTAAHARWQTHAYHHGYSDRVRDRGGYGAYAYEPARGRYGYNWPSCAGDLGYGRPDYSTC
jgi:hypothetical protein